MDGMFSFFTGMLCLPSFFGRGCDGLETLLVFLFLVDREIVPFKRKISACIHDKRPSTRGLGVGQITGVYFDYLEMATAELHTVVVFEAPHHHTFLFLRRSHPIKL